jgi:hypothetical protein
VNKTSVTRKVVVEVDAEFGDRIRFEPKDPDGNDPNFHAYSCRCDECRRWWRDNGPDPWTLTDGVLKRMLATIKHLLAH